MKTLFDLSQPVTIVAIGGVLISVVWLVRRMASKFEVASARCLRELSAPDEAAHRRIGEDEVIGG
jgi:hypothetical protein